DEARQQYEQAHVILLALADATPGDYSTIRNLSVSYNLLGNTALQQSDKKAALEHYLKALDLRRSLQNSEGDTDSIKVDLAQSYVKIGNVARDLGDYEQAETHYLEALKIRQDLATRATEGGRAMRDLWIALGKLGELSLWRQQPEPAVEHFQDCLNVA